MLDHREQHVAHLALVFRGHQHEVWNAAQICDIQKSVMRWAITAGHTATIETKLHIQILNADVVDQLIKPALQKRRIDRADWCQTFTRHAGGKRYAMLLGNADIERTIGKLSRAVQMPVPSGIAAVSATIFSSRPISSASVLPKTVV